ncbi:MAG: hypothetical protein JWR80_924 [Bradyrhizobium sp.]|nr:hypothetical protein [Bradyrhizobium sp.]
MKRAGLDKARARLADAAAALGDVKRSTNYDEFRRAWASFLFACNGVDVILQATAERSDLPSRQWYSAKADFRAADELLHYMRSARNTEEHGLDPVAEHVPGTLTLVAGQGGIIRGMGFVDGKFVIDMHSGEAPDLLIMHEHVKLVAVTDNKGRAVPIPTSHLGKPLTDLRVPIVGDMWLAYQTALLDEAATLVAPAPTTPVVS